MVEDLANDVLTPKAPFSVQRVDRPPNPMGKEFHFRFAAVFLGLLTLAAVVFAWFNVFVAEPKYHAPYDGVWWVEQSDANGSWLKAQRVDPNGPGDNAGVRDGDRLLAINGAPASSFARLTRAQFTAGAYNKVTYTVHRKGVSVDVPVILVPADRSINMGLRLIALVYLAIGFYAPPRARAGPTRPALFYLCL